MSDVAGYLGVLINCRPDGFIIMKKEGLTKRVVEALFFNNNNNNNNSTAVTIVHTPATAYLPIDEEGKPGRGIYNYASVAGMLNYLQGHSRIDITFAVSQVALYVHAPKRLHELALNVLVATLREL